MRASALAVTFVLLVSGCLSALPSRLSPASTAAAADAPLHLPLTDFYNRTGAPWNSNVTTGETPANPPKPFHTLAEIGEHVANWSRDHPDLVKVDVIGHSRANRPLWHAVLTDPSVPGPKPVFLMDGGHHGNEIAGTELTLYLADFVLTNAKTNATMREILRNVELHFVPLVNPDGYAAQTRGNLLGVNLNRNYDVDWGDPYGASNPVMGLLSDTTQQNVPSVTIVAENCGASAFSEPETRAMRDLMERLHDDFAVYFSTHTPANGFISPWAAGRAPFTLPANDSRVFESELQWVRTHTEYTAGKAQWGNFSAGLPYSASGSSMDWAYMRHHVAAYTLELEIWLTAIEDPDYVARNTGPYAGLEYWMKASLPIAWHLLENTENYRSWDLPTRDVPLPPGVPPPVPKGGWSTLASLGMERPPDEGPD